MDGTVALILVQDGVVNGAIYALLALSIVLVFSVTRVILIPQGELVAFAALSFASLGSGRVPGSVWLLCGLGGAAAAAGLWAERGRLSRRLAMQIAAETLGVPAVVALAAVWLAPMRLGVWADAALAVAIVMPMAPYLYRIAFRPLADASILTLLIASVGVHLAMLGLGLAVFGPEGARGAAFSDARLVMGPLIVPGQALWVVSLAVVAMAGLWAFGRSLEGMALRATAVNRLGARLVGIPTERAGRLAFWLAGAIGAASGVLIAPLTTVYYDSGFLIGLKGFVAAITGGLLAYPAAVLAALAVGIGESFASFWASAFKEVIVFAAILPVLLVLSLRGSAPEE